MKLLIVGSDVNAILFAKYLKINNEEQDIYVTTNEPCDLNSYTPLNIIENDIESIVDFVKYNQIELTVVFSSLAIINGIGDIFKKEGFPIIAPLSEAARITFFSSIEKKIMYKLKINTPKFGIFDRENLATDYLRSAKFPVIVENDFNIEDKEIEYYDTFTKAKRGIQKKFENGIEKIVIQNFVDLDSVNIYFITDGYNALPLISIDRKEYKGFVELKAPSVKVSDDIVIKILRNVIYPLLDDISKFAGRYIGVLGVRIKLYKDSYYVLNFYNKFQKYDLQAFLPLLNDDFLKIMFDAANECLMENYNYVNLNDNFSYSFSIPKEKIKIVYENSEDDFIQSEDDKNITYTTGSSTINNAKYKILDYIETIVDNKIYEEVIQKNFCEEIKI